jgi:quercetin dioxygenase-like cupin family protein
MRFLSSAQFIERSRVADEFVAPSAALANRLLAARGLGRLPPCSVSYFVEEPSTPDITVVRADERAQVYTSKQGLDLKNISGRYGPFQIAGAEAVMEPYADSGPTPMNHPGEELVIVLEGTMCFTVDGQRYELEAGDSIHFRTPLPHSWSNPTEQPARAIWLVVRSS